MKQISNHFIITRFNLPMEKEIASKTIDQIDVQTDEAYLNKRFALFLTYTVPSVISQSISNFQWLVLFSDQTPLHFKEKAIELQSICPQFTPLFLNRKVNHKEFIRDYILEKMNSHNVCITTRLDNDDALRSNFVERVQEVVRRMEKINKVLIFPTGFQYDESNQIIADYYFPDNHFSTLIYYDVATLRTILDYNHMEISALYPAVYEYIKEAMWLEVIHSDNLLNRMYLTFKNINNSITDLSDFNLPIKLKKKSKSERVWLVLINKPKNLWRLFCQYGVKKSISKLLIRWRK